MARLKFLDFILASYFKRKLRESEEIRKALYEDYENLLDDVNQVISVIGKDSWNKLVCGIDIR